MIRRLFISFLIITFISHLCFSQEASYDEKLRLVISRNGQAEVIIANPGARSIDRLTRAVSIRSVNSKSVKIILSPLTVEWFLSEGYDFQISEQSENKGVTHSKSMTEAMEWESYPFVLAV